jgi:hypothetical protein
LTSLLGILRDGDRCSVVRVVYSDETGTGSIAEEPLTVVAALMMNLDSQWEPVYRDLEAVRPKPTFEFKGAKLFRDLRNGRKRAAADAILRGVLSIPTRYRVPIFYAAIDRVGYERSPLRQDEASKPYDIALVFCLRSVHTFVYTLLPKERVLWIADKSGGYEHVSQQAREFIGRLAQNAPDELNSGVKEMKPHASFVDTVYFGDSKQSAALQLADVCCSVINLHLQNDPHAEPYYELIRPQILANIVPIFFSEFGGN